MRNIVLSEEEERLIRDLADLFQEVGLLIHIDEPEMHFRLSNERCVAAFYKFSLLELIDYSRCGHHEHGCRLGYRPLLATYLQDKVLREKALNGPSNMQNITITGNDNVWAGNNNQISITKKFVNTNLDELVKSNLNSSHKDYQKLLEAMVRIENAISNQRPLEKGFICNLNQFTIDHGSWLFAPLATKIIDYLTK